MSDFSFARLDVDGALAETADAAGGISRAGFLAAAAGGSAALLTVGAERPWARGRATWPS